MTRIAVHEAGHGISALVQGHKVLEMCSREGEAYTRIATTPPPEARIVWIMAGPAAERAILGSGGYPESMSARDDAMLSEAVSEWTRQTGGSWNTRVHDHFLAKTTELLFSHLSELQFLADELDLTGRLREPVLSILCWRRPQLRKFRKLYPSPSTYGAPKPTAKPAPAVRKRQRDPVSDLIDSILGIGGGLQRASTGSGIF